MNQPNASCVEKILSIPLGKRDLQQEPKGKHFDDRRIPENAWPIKRAASNPMTTKIIMGSKSICHNIFFPFLSRL